MSATARPTAFALFACPRCRATWLADSRMYEETDRCPRCGRYAGGPLYGPGEDIAIGGGTSNRPLMLYTETAGPIRRESDGGFIYTESALKELDYVR